MEPKIPNPGPDRQNGDVKDAEIELVLERLTTPGHMFADEWLYWLRETLKGCKR